MTEPSRRRPWSVGLRTSPEGHRVTTFELFFDLVYVFAFTQVSHLVAETHSGRGMVQALTVLGMLWWTWTSYSWLANQSPADQGLLRFGMGIAMAAVFVATLAIPEAYEDLPGGLFGPLVLVVAYVVVRVVHGALYVVAAAGDTALRRQLVRTAVVAIAPSTALLFVGAVVGEPQQTWIWLAAFTFDVLLTLVTGRRGSWRLYSPTHWAERYGLIVILALGESVVAIGVGASHLPVSWPVITGAALSIAIALLLWWIYFVTSAGAAEHRLAHLEGVARAEYATLAYTYLHYVLIAAVVVVAVGIEEAMAHVGSDEPFGRFAAWALAAGLAAYLLGATVLVRSARRPWIWRRVVEAALLVALVPVLASLPALGALALAAGVVYAFAIGAQVRGSRARSADDT
ncbi:hypothetical protein Cch01nite_23350 [Cellulomonas chitinilytica]|uniref:Low temperature requirement protein A n=1 Tax=Cellulomonas chitinilytica TaxID=398759 RepID=A0A919P1F1_9CELL|nr:low temperature requirement protein A [Cellulomonas chitinilytica]GIG21611.1 hypothetical protein Cch01nite_23350 [Cellulomonas chitinilytica]